MRNMEARCRKAYVCVNLDVDKEGAIRPRDVYKRQEEISGNAIDSHPYSFASMSDVR